MGAIKLQDRDTCTKNNQQNNEQRHENGLNQLNKTMSSLRLCEDPLAADKTRRHSAPEEKLDAENMSLPTLATTSKHTTGSSLDTSLNNLPTQTSNHLAVGGGGGDASSSSDTATSSGDESSLNHHHDRRNSRLVAKLPPLNWAKERKAKREFCYYIDNPKGCIEEAILKRRGFCPTNPKLKRKKKVKSERADKLSSVVSKDAERCSISVPASSDFENTFLAAHQDLTVSKNTAS